MSMAWSSPTLRLAQALLLTAAVHLGGLAVASAAAPPRAMIDLGASVECRDVTPAEFAVEHPFERIIEGRFRMSLLLTAGVEQDLEQMQLTIQSPERRLRVAGFAPRTELSSELASDVEVCNSDDTTKSLNASVGGVVSAEHGVANAQVSPAAGVGVTQNRGSKETYRRLSPKQLVLASGTTNAEHGVFFKWRRSNQATLEGAREVSCQFIVPYDWAGDWVEITCEVVAKHRNYFGEKIEPCGAARALVGLYLTGEISAEQAAFALAAAQSPGSSGATASPSAQQHVAYKPVEASGANSSSDWFSLSSMFKSCSHDRNSRAAATGSTVGATRRDLTTALNDLRGLSGTRP